MKKLLLFVVAFMQLILPTILNAQLTEDFETSVPPAGWTSFIGINGEGTTNDWVANGTANTGAQAAYVQWEAVPNEAEDWLVTSLFTPTGATSELSFFERKSFTTDYGSTYAVKVSTTSQTDIASFSDIITYDETGLNIFYTERTIDISAYIGVPIYIAFVFTNNDGDAWRIDDVLVEEPPSCEDSSGGVISNLTDTSVDLSWTASSNCVSEEYWLLPAGDPAPMIGTGSPADACEMTSATGLTPSTIYDFYLSTTCSATTTTPTFLGTVTTLATPSGCVNTTSFGSATLDGSDAIITISTNQWTTEYTPITDVENGSTYEFSCSLTSDGTHKYVTITDEADVVLAHGPSPFSWVSTVTGNVRAHWTEDEFCNSASVSHTTTVQCTSCPPPCTIDAITAFENGDCDPVTGLYTATVTVNSTSPTTTGDLNVNGQLFPVNGMTSQTVVLTGLVSDGQPVDVTAFFVDDAGCTLTEVAAFTAPVDCLIGCGITAISSTPSGCTYDMVNGSTYDVELTITYSNPPASGTLDVTIDGTTVNELITGSPQIVNVTLLTADGLDKDVNAVFSDDGACTLTELALYTAPNECSPPVNDMCDGALDIQVGSSTCGATTTGNNTNSTDSNNDPNTPAATCTNYAGGDIWFKVTVPASGNVTISGSPSDCCSFLWYETYEGNCGALTSISCSVTSGNNPSQFEQAFSGRTPGEVLYIRAWDSSNDNGPGDFNFCAYEPCGITDITHISSSTCNMNTYDGTYEVSYFDPTGLITSITLEIDGISSTVTNVDGGWGNPATIVVSGLTADGLQETALATSDGGCSPLNTDVNVAEMPCGCLITSIDIDADYNCVGSTYDRDITISYTNEPAGGTIDITGLSTGDLNLPITGSPQFVTLSGLPVDGLTENFDVSFSAEITCTFSSSFTNPAACPPDCDAGAVITCGEVVDITLVGNGAWNGNPCWNSSPGDEVVYKFTADATGTHNLVKTGGTGYIDYQWKEAAGATCDNTGWTCIDDITSNGTYLIGDLTEGTEYWILLDSEGTDSRSHTFHLECPLPPIANAGGIGLCQNAAAVLVDGSNAKVNLLVAGEIIAAISTSEDLGMVQASYIRFDATDNATRDYAAQGDGDGFDMIDRSIIITPTNQPVGPVSVFLYYSDAEYDEIIANPDGDNAAASWTDLGITKFDTDECSDLADPNSEGGVLATFIGATAITGGWEVEIEVSSFSGFQAAEGNTALPIKLNRFTAVEDGRHNMIEWSTATEINVQDHTLMKSNDANNWEVLGIAPGYANSNIAQDYEMVDLYPYTTTYYQLMTTDLDGSVSYSPIVSVMRDSERTSAFLGASPIPTQDVVNLNVYSQVDDNLTITLTDISGKRLQEISRSISQGDHQLPLDLSDKLNGVYLITITSDYIQQTHRVIKN